MTRLAAPILLVLLGAALVAGPARADRVYLEVDTPHAGELVSEYKKFLRDGDAHTLFKDRFAEELGDVLWYLANLATKLGLRLDRNPYPEPPWLQVVGVLDNPGASGATRG